MNDEDIQKIIERSKELVKNIEDPYKISAFQIVLTNLLEQRNGSDFDNKTKQSPSVTSSSQPKHSTNDLEELSEKCSVEIEELNDLILLKEDGTAELLINFDKKTKEQDKQIQGSQCIILALEYATKSDWILTGKLTKSLEHSGISSSHLSRTLENNNYFQHTGDGRGTKYKLSGPGRAETFTLIKKLIDNNI